MRPSISLFATVFRTHPGWPAVYRQTGFTPEMAAADAMRQISAARSPAERDRLFSQFMYAAGINTTGVEAFDRATEQILADSGNRTSMERTAQRMSEQSRQTHAYASPERIKESLSAMRKSSLIQGVADRFRKSDSHEEKQDKLHRREIGDAEQQKRMRDWGADRADRRSAVNAAFLEARPEDRAPKLAGEYDTLRETLSAAYDVNDDARDPFANEQMLDLTDAV